MDIEANHSAPAVDASEDSYILSLTFFGSWLRPSQPGDSIIYLRSRIPSFLAQARERRKKNDAALVGDAVFDAFNHKRIHLFQRRRADGTIEYIAMRTGRTGE